MLAAVNPAAASSFSIAPIRVEMGSAHLRGVLTLHNDGDAPVTIQVSSVAWSVRDGDDHYEATHDIIATPPVFVVAANSDQIVRVALRRDADTVRELSYRLFFQEVPQATSDTFNGLRVSLRIGVPVFVAPTGANPTAALTWQARMAGQGGLEIEASNNGTAHLQITDFDVRFGSRPQPVHVSVSRYVLPDSTVSWRVTLPQGIGPSEPLHIHGFSDHGEIFADVARATP